MTCQTRFLSPAPDAPRLGAAEGGELDADVLRKALEKIRPR